MGPKLSQTSTMSATVLVALATACGGELPAPRAPIPPEQGYAYCQDLAKQSANKGFNHAVAGWALGAGALTVAGVGIGVAATDQPTSDSGKNRYKAAVTVLPLAAAVLAYVAGGQFERSKNAHGLASTASKALNLPEGEQARTTCNSAVAAWNEGSVAGDAAFTAAVGKLSEKSEVEEARTLRLQQILATGDPAPMQPAADWHEPATGPAPAAEEKKEEKSVPPKRP